MLCGVVCGRFAGAAVVLVILNPLLSTAMQSAEATFFSRLGSDVLGTEAPGGHDGATYIHYPEKRVNPTNDDQDYLLFVYALVFVYIYLSVRSVDSVKSKLGLGKYGGRASIKEHGLCAQPPVVLARCVIGLTIAFDTP